jgi:hypothetical protein
MIGLADMSLYHRPHGRYPQRHPADRQQGVNFAQVLREDGLNPSPDIFPA